MKHLDHPALAHGNLLWLFPTLCYLVTAALTINAIREYRRNGTFSIATLGFIGGTSMWWLEWYGDWSAYLQYNPSQAVVPWGQTLWTTPYKPYWMVPAYGAYYAIAIPGGLAIARRVAARVPKVPRTLVLIVVVGVFFWLFDVSIEIPAVTHGWWTYTQTFGPTYHSARGGMLPLAYPLSLNTAFVVVVAIMFDRRGDRGLVWFERTARIGRLAQGARREATRVVVWCVAITAMYFVFFMGPLMILRGIFGHPDPYVP